MLRLLSAILLLACMPLPAAELLVSFSEHKVGTTPAGFRSIVAGEGSPGEWKVMQDEVPSAFPAFSPNTPVTQKRAVLAQLSRDRTDEHFPMLIYEPETFGDFTLTTSFKMVEGQEEQMAGIAFRIQDERNYYYIRASAMGNSFYFFKIVDGIRSAPIGAKAEIPKGTWHDMTIECKGNQIRALLNGKEIIPALHDPSFLNGKIAFWTKSDSVSYFGDTKIIYTPREVLAHVLVRETMAKYPRVQGIKIYGTTTEKAGPCILASDNAAEVGQPGPKEIQDVLSRGQVYHGKDRGLVSVVLPLHDRNGERVAAVKVVMKAFTGQTEKNAVARALPIAKQMESRIQTAQDLLQ